MAKLSKQCPGFWQNTPITVKLSVGVITLLCFLIMVSITGYLSIRFVRKADESILTSTEIQRLVLEMNYGMENARQLHSQFFLQYPQVGLKNAHANFVQPSIRQIAQVVALSKKLQDIISTGDVSDALRNTKVDLNLFLSSAQRFAKTSIEAVQLVTNLATPEQGLESQLGQYLNQLDAELAEDKELSSYFDEMVHFIYDYRSSRERFLMQSAFNISFEIHKAIESHPAISDQQKEKLYSMLKKTSQLSEEILETDTHIKSKFADFILQEKSAGAVSAALMDIAQKEVERNQEEISTTYYFAQIVLFAVALFGLFSACVIAWLINRKITKRIVALTQVAEQLRQGRLDVIVEDEAQDELGELGKTFNFMTVRIRDLVDNLERKISQQTTSIQLETERAQKYLDVAGVMLSVLDSSGNIKLINQKGCELLQTTEKQALGQNWFEKYLPERMATEVRAVFNQLMAGDIEPVEYYENEILTEQGEEIMIAFHNTILRDREGNLEGILFSGEDITEQRRHEEERGKLEAQLRQAHKMEAIGTLAGGIAHDFNNILAAILGFAEMAQDDIPKHSPARYHLNEVLKAGNRAKDLVKHILSFSRKESRVRMPVDVNYILKEVIKFLRATIPTTIEIKENLDTSCGNIYADSTQIHQVIVNLCTNAGHAMEDQGGVLEVTSSCLEILENEPDNESSLKAGTYTVVQIKDNGAGIEPQHMDRIFDPYFTTKEVGKGSGMGLSVVIGIVKSHDGMITVESEPGEGTTFKVYFPNMIKEVVGQVVLEKDIPLPVGKEHILIVDDDSSIATLTQKRLEMLGYQTTAVTSSLDCLDLFKSAPDTYDMVITDQTMPAMTGEQLARELISIRPNIPIILCTGFSSKIDADKAREVGISFFIMKPVDLKELAETVRNVLDSSLIRPAAGCRNRGIF